MHTLLLQASDLQAGVSVPRITGMGCDDIKTRQVTHWDRDYLSDDQLEALQKERGAANRRGSGPLGETRESDLRPPDPSDVPDWRIPGVAALIVGGLTLIVWLFTYGPFA